MRLRFYKLESEEELEKKSVELLEHGCGVVKFELMKLDVLTVLALQRQFDLIGDKFKHLSDEDYNYYFLIGCNLVDRGLYKRLNDALNKLYGKEGE